MKILSFDIEDWWVYDHYSIGNSKDYLPRLDNYLDEILDMLELMNTKATFFCLGKVAESHPYVIKKIHSRGHHIGCHSFSHQFLIDLDYKEVEADTEKGVHLLEDIIGEKVFAYRAPAFSITEKNKWVIEILAKYGITHDCSIFPASRSFGGFPSFKTNRPAMLDYNGIKMKEFPMSTAKIMGKEIAYSGGGYFRLLPYSKIKQIVDSQDYVMTYFHIKDFDKYQKKSFASLSNESALARYFKDYYGLKNSYKKFTKMIHDNDFIDLLEADKLINWDENHINI